MSEELVIRFFAAIEAATSARCARSTRPML